MKPRYTHDCERCTYLGSIDYPAPHHTEERGDYTVNKHADLYVCLESDRVGIGSSIIARFSSRGSNYASAPASIVETHYKDAVQHSTSGPALITALLFAKVKGVL